MPNVVAMDVDEDADDPAPMVRKKASKTIGANGKAKPKEKTKKKPQPPSSIEVIELDDDVEPISKRRLADCASVKDIIDLAAEENSGNSKCVNIACRGNAKLRKCPISCQSYFRVKSKSIKHEICEQCYVEATHHYEKLSDLLRNGDTLYEHKLPAHAELFAIYDSDEEDAEEEPVPKEALLSFKERFVDTFRDVFAKYDVQTQVRTNTDILCKKAEVVQESVEEVDTMYDSIQKQLDRVRYDFYKNFTISYKHETPAEIIDDATVMNKFTVDDVGSDDNDDDDDDDMPEIREIEKIMGQPLPAKGPLQRTPPQVGEFFFAGKLMNLIAWAKVSILEVFEPGNFINDKPVGRLTYRVKAENKQKVGMYRLVCGQELAYINPSQVCLEVGTRVIALFKEIGISTKKEAYFPGIVAEPLCTSNNHRYLVFFDDGYAQYVPHNSVHVIVESSRNVWEDVHMDSSQFIKKYLESYPERPMVKLQHGQVVRTEWNGKWWVATVIKVDASLVQMHFSSDARSEWIYRGSTRLNPMFKEEQAASSRIEKKRMPTKNIQQNMPYVEYTGSENAPQLSPTSSLDSQTSAAQRSVAKKSTALGKANIAVTLAVPSSPSPPPVAPFLPTQVNPPASKVVYYKPRNSLAKPQGFNQHTCTPKCNAYYLYNMNTLNGYNPLSKPLLCGWIRQIIRYKTKKIINYKAPCGRVVRDKKELHYYLRITESNFTVDLFDFDFWVQCLAEFNLEKCTYAVKDISNGLERVPIPLINYYNADINTFNKYSTQRQPMEGVNLNLDPEFLVGCDCEDDCADKSKCSCWQLTLEGQRNFLKEDELDNVGYNYRRLHETVTTGIYECNSRCKCKHTCLNRVVQHPLQLKLQVFQTSNRGWGIRCLNDIPQGTFICIYAGSLLTEQMANEGGKNYGDEYLAELDYIEVAEKIKEDYEEEAYKSDRDDTKSDEDEDVEVKSDADDEFDPKKSTDDTDKEFHCVLPNLNQRQSSVRTRHQKSKLSALQNQLLQASLNESNKQRKEDKARGAAATKEKVKHVEPSSADDTVTISDDEDVVREPSSFNAKSETLDDDKTEKYTSVRQMFGKDEYPYIMDAKNTGNIGRYLNHSCSPNVFVQSVFVDTHDLRFPWVAFFALTYIRAGTELTWNYSYDVGSVPGKIMYCHCGSVECRGRLL